jgi:hypothetical protein
MLWSERYLEARIGLCPPRDGAPLWDKANAPNLCAVVVGDDVLQRELVSVLLEESRNERHSVARSAEEALRAGENRAGACR